MTIYSLAQIAPTLPAKLSYSNLATTIRQFENDRITKRPIRRISDLPSMMTKESSNPKLAKFGRPESANYATLSLSLAPADMAGIDLCPMRTISCTNGCLGHNSGHSVMGKGCANDRTKITKVRAARIRRTVDLFNNNHELSYAAVSAIVSEITSFVKRCSKKGLNPAVRLNAFSDIVWERVWPEIFTRFPGVKFYDYTKISSRLYDKLPANYTLTLSRSENNELDVLKALQTVQGCTAAVVFGVKDPADMPASWNGYKVIDGTADDMRFLDPPNSIVGLSWKGPALKNAYTESLNAALLSGFAVTVA